MSMLCLVLGFGASNGQVKMAILASYTCLGIWGCEKSLSIKIPSISWVSSILPPVFYWIFIRSKFTSFLYKSAIVSTLFTAISPKRFWSLLTTFDPSETQAASTNSEYSSLEKFIYWEISSSFFVAMSTAKSKPSEIFNGWSPKISGWFTLVQELLCLLKKCSCKHNDPSGSITHFIVLTFWQLHQQFCHWVLNLHFL